MEKKTLDAPTKKPKNNKMNNIEKYSTEAAHYHEWPSRRDTKLETTRDLALPTVSGGAGNQTWGGQRGKISLICLEGQSVTPCRGTLFSSVPPATP